MLGILFHSNKGTGWYIDLYNCVSVCEKESGILFALTVISPPFNPKKVMKKKEM